MITIPASMEATTQTGFPSGKNRQADNPQKDINHLTQCSQVATRECSGRVKKKGLERNRNRG